MTGEQDSSVPLDHVVIIRSTRTGACQETPCLFSTARGVILTLPPVNRSLFFPSSLPAPTALRARWETPYDLSYEVAVGSALPPYMATAPRQHVRPYIHAINSSHNGTLYEWCTSVFAEPTRYCQHLTEREAFHLAFDGIISKSASLLLAHARCVSSAPSFKNNV